MKESEACLEAITYQRFVLHSFTPYIFRFMKLSKFNAKISLDGLKAHFTCIQYQQLLLELLATS
jgi:hypothetical protein